MAARYKHKQFAKIRNSHFKKKKVCSSNKLPLFNNPQLPAVVLMQNRTDLACKPLCYYSCRAWLKTRVLLAEECIVRKDLWISQQFIQFKHFILLLRNKILKVWSRWWEWKQGLHYIKQDAKIKTSWRECLFTKLLLFLTGKRKALHKGSLLIAPYRTCHVTNSHSQAAAVGGKELGISPAQGKVRMKAATPIPAICWPKCCTSPTEASI